MIILYFILKNGIKGIVCQDKFSSRTTNISFIFEQCSSTFINTRIQHFMPMYCELILLDLKPLIKGVGMHKPLHNSRTTIEWKLS
jgi:hypothetical protein